MKLATRYLSIAALLASMAPLSASSAVMVGFGVTDTDIRVGESFSIAVFVDGVDIADEVVAFGFDHDPIAGWSLTGVQLGPAFDFDDSALFPDTDIAGSVDAFNIGPSGDDIVLATLTFVSTTSGIFDFGISSDLSDPNEGLFTLSLAAPFDLTGVVSVTVNAAPVPAPAPGSAWLMTAGLLVLFGSLAVPDRRRN